MQSNVALKKGLPVLMFRTFGCGFLCCIFLWGPLSIAQAAPRDVKTVKHGAGQWELTVDGKPFFVKGVVYNYMTVGDDPNLGTLRDWSVMDTDNNGKVDVWHDSWVDQNKNNVQDADEPAVGDWQILKEMGANTLRLYQTPSNDSRIDALYMSPGVRLTFSHPPNKEMFRDLHERHGLMLIIGHFFGEWTIGSGAQWEAGTDFTDPVQRQNLLDGIRVMVEEHKDEPYVLMWMIGNENFNPYDQDNAEHQVEAYLTLVNEAAQLIHKLDPHHPAALCNLADRHMEMMEKYCPDIDIFGSNYYGKRFDALWQKAQKFFDRPVLITEYGFPAVLAGQEEESVQMKLHRDAWADIAAHRYGQSGGGNAIGGNIFVWGDQWSLSGHPWQHDMGENTRMPGEEWFGLTSQGDGSHSPFLRQLRASYFLYKDLWATDEN